MRKSGLIFSRERKGAEGRRRGETAAKSIEKGPGRVHPLDHAPEANNALEKLLLLAWLLALL